jgi:anti-sigma B factor antagonist
VCRHESHNRRRNYDARTRLHCATERLQTELHLEIRNCDGVAVVHCSGHIMYRNEASLLSITVTDLLPRTRYLVLDLSGVEKIDSAGLDELVVLYMQTPASQCVFKLATPRREILDLLQLTNLTSILQVLPTVGEAIVQPCGVVG